MSMMTNNFITHYTHIEVICHMTVEEGTTYESCFNSRRRGSNNNDSEPRYFI